MDKKLVIQDIMQKSNGIAKTSELIAAGLSKSEITLFNKNGYLERICHGYYKLADSMFIPDERLIQKILPEAVVCVESALFYYGYSDFLPRKWTLAVPRSISKTKLKLDIVTYKPYFIQKEFYDLGKDYMDINGVRLPIYDRERTRCDCFKYRSRLDSELFNKAVKAYASDTANINLFNLSKYSTSMRLYDRVMNIMGVLLNG